MGANPPDLCAVTVPGRPRADGPPSAPCFIGQAGADHIVAALATAFEAAARADAPAP